MDRPHQHRSLSSDAVRDPYAIACGEELNLLIRRIGRLHGCFELDQSAGRFRSRHLGSESITVPWHRFDIFRRMQALSQLRNAVVQIVVFDYRVRPYGLHERVFAHQFSGIFHKNAKGVEELALQMEFAVIAKQSSLVHVEEITAKEILGHCQIATGFGGCTGQPEVPTGWVFYQQLLLPSPTIFSRSAGRSFLIQLLFVGGTKQTLGRISGL